MSIEAPAIMLEDIRSGSQVSTDYQRKPAASRLQAVCWSRTKAATHDALPSSEPYTSMLGSSHDLGKANGLISSALRGSDGSTRR